VSFIIQLLQFAFISIILIIIASFDITEFTLWTLLLHRWISTPLPKWAIVRKVNNPIISGGTRNAYVHAYIYNKKILASVSLVICSIYRK